ncbi:MAG: HEPN domain-containing protein [Thermodesulfobacteriota bacterium]|nr:HEPN domain-containing protein [Thermodesulfobacteriota bacterium]
MKPPEVIKTEFTREWVRKAESDFKTASHLLKSSPDLAEGMAFHSQQAAEKYLKAFLVWHQIEFQKTHDIDALLRLVGKVDDKLPEILRDAVALTPYGVDYRYPGEYPEVTRSDAERALRLADRVRAEVRSRLPHLIFE